MIFPREIYLKRNLAAVFLVLASVLLCCGTSRAYAATYPCNAGTIAQLKECVSGLDYYSQQEIILTADMTCSTLSECCGPNNGPLIDLNNRRGKTIRSASSTQIFTLKRMAGQSTLNKDTNKDELPTCHVISGSGASNIVIKDLILDESSAVAPCSVEEYDNKNNKCKETVLWNGASNVTMSNVKVRNGKSYVIRVDNTNGFTLANSEISDSGIIGLYVGTKSPGMNMSQNISITNNTFLRTRTNALAIEGVTGSQKNNISGNTFSGNHWQGLFLNKALNVWSGGGQVFLAQGDNIDFYNNVISDGYCSNCYENFVDGIEIGEPSQPYYPLKNTTIRNNTIYNNHDDAIVVPTWAQIQIDNTVVISNNYMYNNKVRFPTGDPVNPLHVDKATQTGNIVKDVIKEVTWENSIDFPSGWNSWTTCMTGQAVRWYGGADAKQGSYALRMMTGPLTCGTSGAGEGVWIQGLNTPVTPGTTVYVNNWTRNGAWNGKICLAAINSSFVEFAGTCQSFAKDAWQYNGDPLLQFTMPAGTKYFQVKIGLQSPNAYADLDSLRVAW